MSITSVGEAHAIALETLTERLAVDIGVGLADDEAGRRLAAVGPNALRSSPPEPWWRRIVRQFQDPLVYLLLVAIVISLGAWAIEGDGFPVDAVVIAAIVLANAAIGYVQERKAQDAVAALASMTEAQSTVLRGGLLATVPSRELVPGDVLVLGEGDAVGADARLVSATGLRVQEAALTGESEASDKRVGALDADTPLGDRTGMVFKGTAVAQGVGRAVVTGTGMQTELGTIADLLDRTPAETSPLEREVAQVSKTLGLLVLGIAVVVMVTLALLQGVHTVAELVQILLLGVSLAVAAVPEGLPAILSLVLAIGVRELAGRNAVMKDLRSVETLGSVSVICSDKTGTLTRNEMTLRTVVTASGRVELTGTGYAPDGEADARQSDAALTEARGVIAGGALANNAQLREVDGEWRVEGDPTEAAFLVARRKLEGGDAALPVREAEVPFTSERKLMSVVCAPASGPRVVVTKGAPDVLLDRCVARRIGAGLVPLDEDARDEILADVADLSAEGYRTLAVAFGEAVHPASEGAGEEIEQGLTWLGFVGIIDPPREEASAAVAEARRAGVRTIMITGDHPATARRIARDLGIIDEGGRTATGADLDGLNEQEFAQTVREVSVYARVAPQHKLRIVDALQADGNTVAMTGDGVNDAPALKSADIGIAMGVTGTEVTKDAATMILGDDNYATIVAAVRQGRAIFDNIRKFLRYLLSSNAGEVVAVFFGVVLAGFLGLTDPANPDALVVPLLATQILWINLVTDSGPALAMGFDPETTDVMARRPRHPDERLIDGRMWTRVGIIGAVMGLVTLLTIDLFLPGGLIEGGESVIVARTAGFTTLVLAQLFNAFNSRADETSALRQPFSNRWLWGSVLLAVGLQVAVVHVPALQEAFSTAPLTLGQWAVTLAMASAVLWVEELIKLVRRQRRRG